MNEGVTGARGAAILALLALLNVLNFTDRYLIQAFAVDMIADLHLSNAQFALLTGFVFTVFYAVMALLMGVLADRFHRPRLIAAGVALWSLLTAATGMGRDFLQIAIARMFIGVGEATLTPAALGLLGDVVSRGNRALAAGAYYLGAPVGIGGAYLIAAALGPKIGWRPCFYALAMLGLLLTLTVLTLREPRATTSAEAAQPLAWRQALRDIRDVLTQSKATVLLIAGGTLVIFALGSLVLDQVWLVQERGLSKVQAQNLAGVVFLAGGIIGTLLGGLLGDQLQARRSGGRLYFLAALYLFGIPACYGYRFADPHGSAFRICMFLGSAVATMGYGPIFASLQDLVPERIRSTMTAVMVLSMTLIGTSFGNLFVGWLADRFAHAGAATPLTWAAALAMAPGLLAVPCFFQAGRWVERGAPSRAAVWSH